MNSNTIAFHLDQFSHTAALMAAVPDNLLRATVSLCHQCYQHVPAYVYHRDHQLWLVKQCRVHGITHHMIDRDWDFIKTLTNGDEYKTNRGVLIEVTDRCNVDCPHCYHMPDNDSADRSINDILRQVETFYRPGLEVVLMGAEASLRRDFPELITSLVRHFDGIEVTTVSNGIRFANLDFLKQCMDAGLAKMRIGLNHPSYLDNRTIRQKQIQSIENYAQLGYTMQYISYTMSSMSELEDILEETTASGWNPLMYRIRYGSDIGRYPDQPRMYVSDIVKVTQDWCQRQGRRFQVIENADNNIYHVMVQIDDILYRLIQWCDETDIDMEELRCGPWCDFVPDGITNFLHQIIRRDVWKNRGIALTDPPPDRYLLANVDNKEPLDFGRLR